MLKFCFTRRWKWFLWFTLCFFFFASNSNLLSFYIKKSPSPLLKLSDICYDFTSADDLLNFAGIGDSSQRCRNLIRASKEIFDFQLETGQLGHVELKVKIENLLGGDQDLIARLYKQTILHVHNKWTGETTMINPLKAKRPGQNNKNNKSAIVSQIKSNQATCDFCSADNMTAQDTFGRILGKFSVTAENLFTVSGPHSGMVIFRTHSFLDLDGAILGDMLEVAGRWYSTVNTMEPGLIFPSMSWDLMTGAGASQVHPHLHMFLDRRRHQGHFGQLYTAADAYNKHTGRDYWDDLVQIHTNLGLAVNQDNSSILVPLTSKRDHEFLVVYHGNSPFVLGNLLHTIIKTYTEHLSVLCWNMGVAWPPLNRKGENIWEQHCHEEKGTWFRPNVCDRPILLRIGSRGDCSSMRSDVSTHELYIFYGLNVDPYTSITNLKHVINQKQ